MVPNSTEAWGRDMFSFQSMKMATQPLPVLSLGSDCTDMRDPRLRWLPPPHPHEYPAAMSALRVVLRSGKERKRCVSHGKGSRLLSAGADRDGSGMAGQTSSAKPS